MNRLIAVTMGLLLGASAVTASAEGYSRGRDEGNQGEQAQSFQDKPRNEIQEQPEQRQGRGEGRRGDGDQRGGSTQGFAVPGSGGYAQEQQPSSGGYQREGRGQRQDYTPSRGAVYGLANPGGQQPRDSRGDRGNWNNGHRGDWDNGHRRDSGYRGNWNNGYRSGNDYRHNRHWSGRLSWRNDWNHGWSGHRYRSPARYYYPRGHSRLSWSVGFQLPSAFYGSNYYVDYRPYGLAPPPYGFRWIRADGDVLLVDLDTGEVVDVLYDFFY